MARVLLDCRVSVGGVGRYGRDLAHALAQLDNGLDVRTYNGASTGLRRWATAPFTPWGRRAVGAEARRWGADLVHGLHLEVPRTARIPKVVTIQDLIPLDHPASMPNPLRRVLFAHLVNLAVGRVERVIVPSDATAAALIRHGAPASKIVVVPHGVARAFRPLSHAERAHARRRWADGRRYVAAIAHPKAHKNLPGLLAAAALIAQQSDAAVVCVGHAPRADSLQARFVGTLSEEDLSSFYGGAEATVVASFVEGFGLPALESLACGTPVVCGPGVGALPYIREGVIVADVARPEEIAAAVLEILTDDAKRGRLADRGLAAARILSPEQMARATLAVYSDVLGRE